jgi:uracil-DNA glycosylase
VDDSVNLPAQVRVYLQSLRTAGVDYLPQMAQISPPAPVASPSSPATNLFAAINSNEPIPTTASGRQKALTVLAEAVVQCQLCPDLVASRAQTVFGVGPLSPEIAFIGEGPGADEDRLGEPFVGASGQLLNKIIAAMGMKRSDVYIMNAVNCHPAENRTPTTEECRNCRPYVERQLELVQPKVIVCLGAVAAQSLLDTREIISKLRGKWLDFAGTPLLCSYHPAALLRNPEWKKDTWADMQMVLTKLGREIPKGKG